MLQQNATGNVDTTYAEKLVARLKVLVEEDHLPISDFEFLAALLRDSMPNKSRLGLTELPEAFLKKFEIREETGCWEWVAGRNAIGYGRFRWGGSDGKDGRVHYAHRFAYEVLTGESPEGRFVDHLCENKSCVNPDHLELVSPEENFSRIHRRTNAGAVVENSPSAALRARTNLQCCSPGCERMAFAKELCRSHYDSMRRAK